MMQQYVHGPPNSEEATLKLPNDTPLINLIALQ